MLKLTYQYFYYPPFFMSNVYILPRIKDEDENVNVSKKNFVVYIELVFFENFLL